MSTRLIWDLPVRTFHALLAVGILAAFALAKLVDHHSAGFSTHKLIGLAVGFAVLLRLIWAVVGTRHARFAALAFSPGEVVRYLRGVFTGTGGRHPAHNPASAYAIVAMVALTVAVIASGLLMAYGFDAAEEVHEVAVYALLAVAAVHVLGVAIHGRRFRENLALSMVTGKKVAEESAAITSARPIAGIAFLALVGLFAAGVFANYDRTTERTRLPLLGTAVALGEAGEAGEAADSHDGGHQEDDHD